MLIATDPLSLVFIACFLFGLLFMVGATLMGSFGHSSGHVSHVHAGSTIHTGHTHFTSTTHHIIKGSAAKTRGVVNSNFSVLSYANPTTVALFLLGFGFFGYVFHDTAGFVLPLTLLFAIIGGLVITALLLAFLNRVFGDSEGETIQDVSDRTGVLGKVSLTIQENGIGEVLYISPGGMRKSVAARSVDGRRLERDQEVVVVNYQRGFADVDTWDHFVNRADHGDIPAEAVPDEDEIAALRALLEEPEAKDTQFIMQKDTQKE